MRRLPAELRRALANEVRDQVAEPLAADIRGAWRGPYARALSGATKARVQTDPQVVVGGSRRVVSGGASARDLVYGTEWGGGRRVKAIPSRPGRRGHRRRTTQQFARQGQHAVYGTIHRGLDRYLDRWADAVERIVGKVMDDG
jgi:hypothetical protein